MFIGRDYYLGILSALWRKNTSSLAVVSGRRRIGKSTLVERFAALSKCRFIEIEGLAPDKGMTNEKQIAKKKFTNIWLGMGPYSTKKVTFTFDSATKADIIAGDYDYDYWYTYSY